MSIMIGLTGQMRSGKDTIVLYLQKHGFECISLSSEVRKEAQLRGLFLNRTNLQNVGDILRKEEGNEILSRRAKRAIDEMHAEGKGNKIVINGLRNPAEIDFLRKHYPTVKILGIIAPTDVRYSRAKELNDKLIQEEFERDEKRDRGVEQEKNGNNVDKCLAMVDISIENNGTVEELHKRLEKILESEQSSSPE